jgi:hypothetical protein
MGSLVSSWMRERNAYPYLPWLARPSFGAGIASIGDIFGSRMSRVLRPVSPDEALTRDFAVIANDFRRAVRKVLTEEGQQERLFESDAVRNGH